MAIEFPQKWRPSLTMVVVGMLSVVLCLPLAGLMLIRFYDTQLARETENELIAQMAVVGATMEFLADERNLPEKILGAPIPEDVRQERQKPITPISASVDVGRFYILDRRPAAEPAAQPIAPEFMALGTDLGPILRQAQKTTLAGYRILDPFGNVIAGRDEIGQSLSHVEEVKAAIAGHYKSVLRERVSDEPVPPLASVSRGARIRVFATLPVFYKDRVVGIVYASRTPSNVLKQLYFQRGKVFIAAIVVLFATLLMAYVFMRTIKAPLDALRLRTERLGRGERQALKPLKHHGTREVAELSKGVLTSAQNLFERSDFINTFATHVSHELKSPLTSIQGAAELLRDTKMRKAEQQRFLDNMLADTDRLVALLDRLRQLARAENPLSKGPCRLDDILAGTRKRFDGIDIDVSAKGDPAIAMDAENGRIIFDNLIENALHHGADRITITTKEHSENLAVEIADNGSGVSKANAEKIFDLFFTTRRKQSGTGMGLGIVQAVLKAHNGKISLKQASGKNGGAVFEITLPIVA